jgi:shikimate kinase
LDLKYSPYIPNITLTGFMGTGKSTVAPLVAERLARPFVDTDTLVVEYTGKSIPELFSEPNGETYFRWVERFVCLNLLTKGGYVIATGGGTLVADGELRAEMQTRTLLVCLTAHPEIIEARILEDTNRPLAANWRARLAERQAIYDAMPHHVDTSHKPPEAIAEEIITLWNAFDSK